MDKTETKFSVVFYDFIGFHVLFTGSISTLFSKINFKTKSHGTIYTFKNYFIIMFLVYNFQILAISGIQTNPYSAKSGMPQFPEPIF